MNIKYEKLLQYIIDGLTTEKFEFIDDYVLCRIFEIPHDEFKTISTLSTSKKVKYYSDSIGFNSYGKWQAFMTFLLTGMPVMLALDYNIKPMFNIDVSTLVKYIESNNELPPFPNIDKQNVLDSIEIIKVIKNLLEGYNE